MVGCTGSGLKPESHEGSGYTPKNEPGRIGASTYTDNLEQENDLTILRRISTR